MKDFTDLLQRLLVTILKIDDVDVRVIRQLIERSGHGLRVSLMIKKVIQLLVDPNQDVAVRILL